MARELSDLSIVTSYFAKASALEKIGYTVVSIAQRQPDNFNHQEILALAPSSFCRDLSRQKRHKQSADEYMKLKQTSEMLVKIEEQLLQVGQNLIALCCWEKDDSICHRATARKLLKKKFKINVEEF